MKWIHRNSSESHQSWQNLHRPYIYISHRNHSLIWLLLWSWTQKVLERSGNLDFFFFFFGAVQQENWFGPRPAVHPVSPSQDRKLRQRPRQRLRPRPRPRPRPFTLTFKPTLSSSCFWTTAVNCSKKKSVLKSPNSKQNQRLNLETSEFYYYLFVYLFYFSGLWTTCPDRFSSLLSWTTVSKTVVAATCPWLI